MVTSIESTNFFHKKWTMISRRFNYITTCIWLVNVCIQPAFVVEYIDCVSELLSCISKRNVNAGNLSSNNCYHHYIINSIPRMFFLLLLMCLFIVPQLVHAFWLVNITGCISLYSLLNCKVCLNQSYPPLHLLFEPRGMIDILLTLFS